MSPCDRPVGTDANDRDLPNKIRTFNERFSPNASDIRTTVDVPLLRDLAQLIDIGTGDPDKVLKKAIDTIDKLRKFKSFVHCRLDDMGIPTNPDGPHSKEGCRIGDRLDIVQRRLISTNKNKD